MAGRPGTTCEDVKLLGLNIGTTTSPTASIVSVRVVLSNMIDSKIAKSDNYLDERMLRISVANHNIIMIMMIIVSLFCWFHQNSRRTYQRALERCASQEAPRRY